MFTILFLTCVSTDYIPMSLQPKLCICTTAASTLSVNVNVNVCSCTKSTLTSASASASRVLWSPKLACRVVLGEDRCAWLSTKAFLSGWLMQLALPKVVSRRFSGLSAGPLLTATLCGLQGLGMSLGGWSVARLGLWLSVLFLWRGTAAPSDRTLTLIISFVLVSVWLTTQRNEVQRLDLPPQHCSKAVLGRVFWGRLVVVSGWGSFIMVRSAAGCTVGPLNTFCECVIPDIERDLR